MPKTLKSQWPILLQQRCASKLPYPHIQQAAQEFCALNQIVVQAQENHQDRDRWTDIWGSAKYASNKFYTLNFASIVALAPFKWIWKSKVSKKIKIFIWLFFRDRINSRNLHRRNNYKIDGDDYSCVLCNLNIEELSYHLIFQCPFSSECWNYLGFNWDHSLYLTPSKRLSRTVTWTSLLEIFSIAAWEIWKQRNGKIFRGLAPTFQSWKDSFLYCTRSQMYRLNQDNRLSLQSWLASLT
jgi:hypothetical protein